MRRSILLILAAHFLIFMTAGCDSLVGWGELGDEVSAGPYKFRPPKKFKRDAKMSSSSMSETKVAYRGPVFGKSEPGIVLSYGPHRGNFSRQAPNWSEAVRRGLMGLKSKCSPGTWTSNSSSPTTLNGLPAVRVQFSGKFQHKGESRAMAGIGYLAIDDTNLMFAIGMDFGPSSSSNVSKLEASLKSIRPSGGVSVSWNSGGSSSAGSDSVAGSPSYPGSGSSGSSGYPGASGPPGSSPSYPGAGSGYPGASRPPGSSGYPGSSGRPGSGLSGRPGMSGPSARVGGPGSSPSSPPRKPIDPEELKRRAEEAKRRAERLAVAGDKSNPEYFEANLEILQSGEDTDVRQAVERMTEADPKNVENRSTFKGIAQAVQNVAADESVHFGTRVKAVNALVIWGSKYSIPYLVELLEDGNHFVQAEALKELRKFHDERAIEPVTNLFLKDASLRSAAAECLRGFGPAAETSVLTLARPTDFMVTQATVQLLGDIGTSESIKHLRSTNLRKLPFFKLVQKDINLAVGKIRTRIAGTTDADKSKS